MVGAQPQGLPMRELRQRVYQVATTQYPGEPLDAVRVDAQLTDLLNRREVESAQPLPAPHGPLPDDLVIRPPQVTGTRTAAMPRGPQLLTFGPASAPQLRTDVVSRLAVADRLSSVSFTYRSTVRGADLAPIATWSAWLTQIAATRPHPPMDVERCACDRPRRPAGAAERPAAPEPMRGGDPIATEPGITVARPVRSGIRGKAWNWH